MAIDEAMSDKDSEITYMIAIWRAWKTAEPTSFCHISYGISSVFHSYGISLMPFVWSTCFELAGLEP